jgi:hypothetical protein
MVDLKSDMWRFCLTFFQTPKENVFEIVIVF